MAPIAAGYLWMEAAVPPAAATIAEARRMAVVAIVVEGMAEVGAAETKSIPVRR